MSAQSKLISHLDVSSDMSTGPFRIPIATVNPSGAKPKRQYISDISGIEHVSLTVRGSFL